MAFTAQCWSEADAPRPPGGEGACRAAMSMSSAGPSGTPCSRGPGPWFAAAFICLALAAAVRCAPAQRFEQKRCGHTPRWSCTGLARKGLPQ
jgi:hypothetical protein